jgi:hypothetical protein
MDIIVPDNTDTDTIIPYIYYRILSFQIQILPLQTGITFQDNSVTYITIPDNTLVDTIIPYTILTDIIITDNR